MIVATLIVFFALCPRAGRVSPILRTDLTEQVLSMTLIAVFFSGVIMALAGAPIGMPVAR
jgi:hypothetical protein